jgi:class 3 adenylate cyclase
VAESVELRTIWLVDLVGSTRLATAVGPVRADELRDEYFALLREAIDTSGGREFKNTGDGLFVAFSSASAAVSCAVLTEQLFERRYRGAEQARCMSGSAWERVSRRSKTVTISGCRRSRRPGCVTGRRRTGSLFRR